MTSLATPILLRETSKTVRAALEQAFQEKGLDEIRPQDGHLLHCIDLNPGCTSVDLAALQCVSKSNISFSLNLLVEKGFIEFVSNEEDRREKRIILTEKGRRHQEAVGALFVDFEKEMLRGFTKAEEQSLRNYLKRIIDNAERRNNE